MTRVTLAALGILTALALPAAAADMPGKAPQRPEPPQVNACVWCGFYIGAQAGWLGIEGEFGRSTQKADGFVGGGHFGYNWQYGNVVAGLELSGTYIDNVKQSGSNSGCGCFVTDLTGKVGFVMGRDLLLYGTAGVSWVNADFFGLAPNMGWVAGAGVDYALTRNIVIGGLYKYRSYENDVNPISISGHEFTGRISLKFAPL